MAGTNPIDQETVVGQPHPRIKGSLKTTGHAIYFYENHEAAPNATLARQDGDHLTMWSAQQIVGLSLEGQVLAPVRPLSAPGPARR